MVVRNGVAVLVHSQVNQLFAVILAVSGIFLLIRRNIGGVILLNHIVGKLLRHFKTCVHGRHTARPVRTRNVFYGIFSARKVLIHVRKVEQVGYIAVLRL